jgi:hypothetical protein
VPRTSILDPQGVYVIKIPEGPVPVPVLSPVTVSDRDRDRDREKGEVAASQDAGPVEDQDPLQLQLPATEPLSSQREAETEAWAGTGAEVVPPVLYLWIGESHSPLPRLTLLTVFSSLAAP